MSSERSTGSTLNSAARRVLQAYPRRYHPQDLIDLRSSGGFSGARLWRVESTGGSYCLRATPRDDIDERRLRGLHELLLHIERRGIAQSPAPVEGATGATYRADSGFVWQLEPWMPGVADFHEHPRAARLRNALSLLARWHQAAATFVPTGPAVAWFSVRAAATSPGIESRLARIREWNSAKCNQALERLKRRDWPDFDDLGGRCLDLYAKSAGHIERDLELGRRIVVPVQPCLRDVWHDHVLFVGDEVTGLIDAHACRTDTVATDLARLLGSLVGNDRAAWNVGLSAYEELRPLSLAERGLVELFDRSAVLLNGLTWLEWKCFEGRRFDRPQTVLKRMQAIVARMAEVFPPV